MKEKNAFLSENKDQLILFGVTTMALLVILIGIIVWEIPVVGACILIFLEAALAVCMQNVPIWLHGAIMTAQVVTGAVFGRPLFLLLCGVFYMICILALNVWKH